MKKLILIIILLMCTGCFDYKEISDLAIVSAMGIDYVDNEYIVSMEVLNDSSNKESSTTDAFVECSKAKTLTEAIDKVSDKLPKRSSFTHMNLLILGNNILNNKLEDIIDLFLRNTYFRESFYIIGTKNKPDELLNNTSKDINVASDAITRILENMSYSTNANIIIDFQEFMNTYFKFGKDNTISNVVIKDKDFIIDGMIILDNLKYKATLDNEMAKMYNVLTNNFKRATFSKKYDEGYFTVGLSDGKIKISVSDKIYVKGSIEGRIIDNDPNFDIRNTKVIDKLNKDFTKIINDLSKELINYTKYYNSDILGLSNKYYQTKRIKDENIFKNLKIDANINFKISKKGLTYEIRNKK